MIKVCIERERERERKRERSLEVYAGKKENDREMIRVSENDRD